MLIFVTMLCTFHSQYMGLGTYSRNDALMNEPVLQHLPTTYFSPPATLTSWTLGPFYGFIMLLGFFLL